jgi:hypothetical protein
MIVSTDTRPDRDLYFLGAKVIDALVRFDEVEVDYFELFERVNSEEEITLNLYTLVLDWLFILGIIDNAQKGAIRKCF